MSTRQADDRIIALEEKLLFQEDGLQKLDDVITRQYKLIDTLTRRIADLEKKVDTLGEELEKQPATVTDERPPHY